jgi:cytochrome c553
MKELLTGVLTMTWLLTAPAWAGDAAVGKSKTASCIGCHGMAGISANPIWPNLAGQHEAYLVKQMKDFKAGTRTDPNMNALMAPLSEADMADIAAYFSSLDCK